MNVGAPLMSVGIPVFNGEKFIRCAIESILNQTFQDFELIICDNASTDGTQAICLSYAQRDPRIKYFRNSENIGAARNFTRAFHLSTGKYFKWVAHDDAIASTFLEKCIDRLEEDSSTVLCFSEVLVINEENDVVDLVDPELRGSDSDRPYQRFKTLLLKDRSCFDIFGVIRCDALLKTRVIAEFIASDRILRAELCLLGKFHVLPEPLFLSRDHPERSIRSMPAHHLRASWFDPALAGRPVFPHWRLFFEYFKCVRRSGLSPLDQISCGGVVILWLANDLNWARLIADFIIAANPNSWKLLYRHSIGWADNRPGP